MRFWLAAFVVLFVAVELFEWMAQIGSWHADGIWLVLGGMGLAAVSNWGGWNRELENGRAAVESKDEAGKILDSSQAIGTEAKDADTRIERSSDSISFKVRPLKR